MPPPRPSAFLASTPLSQRRGHRPLHQGARRRAGHVFALPRRRRVRVLPPARAALGGAVLSVSDLRLQAGPRELVHVPQWSVTAGQCVGIVGANGAGKSTLLRSLRDPCGGGPVQVAPGATVGYLPQQAVSGSARSVWDEAASEMRELRAAEAALRAAEADAADGDGGGGGGGERLARALAAFEAAGGYAQDERIARVLGGLGFQKGDWARAVGALSGGWQMRVALARLLLQEPTLMLLDEPTNHLDAPAKAYLARYLHAYRHTVVVVSHDAALLDGCCSRIVEIADARFAEYPGCNYSRYLAEKDARALAAASAAAKTAAEAARLEAFIARFGAKATKARSAQSKQKALDRLLAANPDAPTLAAPDRHESTLRLTLPPAPPCAREPIALRNVDVGYDPDAPVIRGVSLTLERGSRYGICGRNGSGKTTLLKTLAGKLPPLNAEGVREVGDDRVACGVFTQDLAADLPTHLSALQHLETLAPDLTKERIRGTLGALGIRGPAALREMGYLSGGEQARVALASFVVQSQNVLFCDEVSNHLDVESVETVCEALLSFDGALVIVSHDRRLIERVATHCIVVDEGKAKLYDGVPQIALDMITLSSEDGMSASVASKNADNGITEAEEKKKRVAAMQERKEAQKRISRAQKRLPKVQTEIEKLEEGLSALQSEMDSVGTRSDLVMAIQEKVEETEAKIESLYTEMQDLEVLLEEASVAA